MFWEKKTVFVPMSEDGFRQSFAANVKWETMEDVCRKYADDGFIGKQGNCKYTLSYYQFFNWDINTILKCNIKPCNGGITIYYHYTKPLYIIVPTIIAACIVLFWLSMMFVDLLTGSYFNPSLYTMSLLFLILDSLLLFIRPKKAKKRLYNKLNEVCGGLLGEENG